MRLNVFKSVNANVNVLKAQMGTNSRRKKDEKRRKKKETVKEIYGNVQGKSEKKFKDANAGKRQQNQRKI